MRMLSVLVMFFGSLVATPTFAQTECCQCGPSACGPAPESGDCSGCELVPHALCNGDTGLCTAALEGALPPTAPAPVLGGSPFLLLAAGLSALAVSLLRRRRRG